MFSITSFILFSNFGNIIKNSKIGGINEENKYSKNREHFKTNKKK